MRASSLAVAVLALPIVLAGCPQFQSDFTVGSEPTRDAASDESVRDVMDATQDVVTTQHEAGDGGQLAEAGEASASDATGDSLGACTCGDAGSSCFYSVDEPPSGYGLPYPVTTVVLTPSAPTATFTATVAEIPQPYHDVAWYDLDVSAFVNGGTMYIQGQVGDGNSTVSSYLMAQCGTASATGSFPSTPLESNGNVIDSAWTFPSYEFPAGTTALHFGTEGSWGNPANSTNTNKVTVLAQP